jgi:cytochrome b6
MSVPPKLEVRNGRENPSAKREMKFFPNFYAAGDDGLVRGPGGVGRSGSIFPWNLGVKADPFVSAPAGIKPEWYFLFMFQTLKLIPSKVWFVDGEVWV